MNEIESLALESPWSNAYWFARMLLNNDKYGAIGSDNKILATLASQLRLITDRNDPEELILNLCKQLIANFLKKRFENAPQRKDRVQLLINDLSKELKTIDDIDVLILTMEVVLIRINNALRGIPNNDREFAEQVAKAYLDTLGEKGLSTVLNVWDDAGIKGCLTAERTAVVREFSAVKNDLSNLRSLDTDLVLTAFVQEFERRLGQKRKSRAGGSLEDVTTFIFNYFSIKAANKPDHLQADFEIDKFFKCKDSWLIGISCKRTLRERWKQVASANREILNKYKIRQVWHVLTFDEDLSDEKITSLGIQGHIFYLSDDSHIFKNAIDHIGMKRYVRPMSQFISDIRAEQNKL